MGILSYGLLAALVLAMVLPAIAFAESENEAGEAQPSAAGTQPEQEGDDAGHGTNSAASGLILLVTVAAIVSVVGYSAWKVYGARRKAASKRLV